jgi:5-hydroxyisourate hydrolase
MTKISTHILDVSLGRPATNVPVLLEAKGPGGSWSEAASGVTDSDGRLKDLAANKNLSAGIYRLTFETGEYFAAQQMSGLYPQVVIIFETKEGQEHYHIPLLLSPFGYSTYRGS